MFLVISSNFQSVRIGSGISFNESSLSYSPVLGSNFDNIIWRLLTFCIYFFRGEVKLFSTTRDVVQSILQLFSELLVAWQPGGLLSKRLVFSTSVRLNGQSVPLSNPISFLEILVVRKKVCTNEALDTITLLQTQNECAYFC